MISLQKGMPAPQKTGMKVVNVGIFLFTRLGALSKETVPRLHAHRQAHIRVQHRLGEQMNRLLCSEQTRLVTGQTQGAVHQPRVQGPAHSFLLWSLFWT